jgi:hypothetical protein
VWESINGAVMVNDKTRGESFVVLVLPTPRSHARSAVRDKRRLTVETEFDGVFQFDLQTLAFERW